MVKEMDAGKLGFETYNKPKTCEKCGGVMVYKGVGEYRCEKCNWVSYDDYGKARNYLEDHKGANISDVSKATGVSQKAIRQMLKESKLEVSENSRTFIFCEKCGASIRFGRLCPKCESLYKSELMEKDQRKQNSLAGFGKNTETSTGAKRFKRSGDE